MLPRFFLEQPPSGPEVLLGPAESHHLMHVRRIPRGAEVELFDGTGPAYRATVTDWDRSRVRLTIGLTIPAELPGDTGLVLGVGFPKTERQKFLVEKCVELGVRRLVPLVTEYGVARIDQGVMPRLRRLAIESCKQCGRNRLIEFSQAMDLTSLLEQTPADSPRWFAEPAGRSEFMEGQVLDRNLIYAAVGPEGGWSPAERELAKACGWQSIGLSSHTLRTETAAVVLAGICAVRHLRYESTSGKTA